MAPPPVDRAVFTCWKQAASSSGLLICAEDVHVRGVPPAVQRCGVSVAWLERFAGSVRAVAGSTQQQLESSLRGCDQQAADACLGGGLEVQVKFSMYAVCMPGRGHTDPPH